MSHPLIVKSRRDYFTRGTPAFPGFPGVAPERVRVTGFVEINGDRWCRVRFANGDRLVMHPTNLRAA